MFVLVVKSITIVNAPKLQGASIEFGKKPNSIKHGNIIYKTYVSTKCKSNEVMCSCQTERMRMFSSFASTEVYGVPLCVPHKLIFSYP